MEKEKIIEEMARELVNIDIEAENGASCRMNFEQATTVACELIDKGYRKESDVVAEVLSLGKELLKEITDNTELSVLEKKVTQAGVQLLITKIEKKYKKTIMCCECKYCTISFKNTVDEAEFICIRTAKGINVDPTGHCSRAKMKGAE